MTTSTPNDNELASLATEVGRFLLAGQRRLVTAESCTGGWIGKVLTDVPGSSRWFLGGAIVYSNQLKQAMLGVESSVLAAHGAVSEATVRAMAEGALRRIGGELAIAVSGVAGPDGGTPTKPVGTVWFAWSRVVGQKTLAGEQSGGLQFDTQAERMVFAGDRERVRRQAVFHGLRRVSAL